MKKLLVAVAAVAAFALVGEGVEVSTVEALTAALAGSESEIVIAEGTYTITAALSVNRAVTVRAADGASVTIDAQEKCQCLSINHADAVVEGIRIYRGKGSGSAGGGVGFGNAGGTLRNCVVDSCIGASGAYGHGIYIKGKALVTGCVIQNCVAKQNGTETAIGVYIADGTLENCLVTGCTRTGYPDRQPAQSAVYLAKGAVQRCTIAGNSVTHDTLYVNDSADCVVRDTIVWGNTTLRDTNAGRPNVCIGAKAVVSGLCTTIAVGENAVVANPSFVNPANGDFRLSPASPCRGAGTDGCDLGYADYADADALGIAASAYDGTQEVTVSLVAGGSYSLAGASVAWKLNGQAIEESGTSFVRTFGPGCWTVSADVTLADGTPVNVVLENAVRVLYTGEVRVAANDSDHLNDVLANAADGLVLRLAEGDYSLYRCYSLVDGIKIIGDGDRFKTVLSRDTKKAAGRVFYINNENVFIANVTMAKGSTQREAGGLWFDANGGSVSNCVLTGCKSGTNAGGGGAWMNSAKAVISHTLISSNIAGGSSPGGGVLLSKGTLADCLIVSNTMDYVGTTRTSSNGGGVQMDTATTDAKIVNCTIAHNKATAGGGLHRKANAGFVVNTIIYDNTEDGGATTVGSPNWVSIDGTTLPTAIAFSNCCSSAEVGVDSQSVKAAPYDAVYQLNGTTAASCINKGLASAAFASVDYLGNARMHGNGIDIGAIESQSSAVTVDFAVDKVSGLDRVSVKLTAMLTGAEPDEFESFTWFVDGEEIAEKGAEVTHEFSGAGSHSIKLVAVKDGETYETAERADVSVLPKDVYVSNSGAGIWPYDTEAKASTDICVAVSMQLDGMCIHVAVGDYPVTNTLSILKDITVIGAGMDQTVVYSREQKRKIFIMNAEGSTVDSLCISNGWCSQSEQGGNVEMTVGGGTLQRCRVIGARGAMLTSGVGISMDGSKCVVRRCEIVDNCTGNGGASGEVRTVVGGGVKMSGSAVLENCLVCGNVAKYMGGGVHASNGAIVRNCTIVGNVANAAGDEAYPSAGIFSNWTPGGSLSCVFENNIVCGNVVTNLSTGAVFEANCGGNFETDYRYVPCVTYYSYCCDPCGFVTNHVVTADPQFRDAANGDYRIGASSPCAYSGVYQSDWMEGATDFFSNPRATPGKKVSIGYYQVPNPGLMLLVR